MLMSTTPSESNMESRTVMARRQLDAGDPGQARLKLKRAIYLQIGIATVVVIALFAIVSILVFVCSKKSKVLTEDYCNPKLCPKGGKHTACKPKKSENCEDFRAFNLTKSDETKILNLHNRCRSKVADSALPASDMKKLIWDEELAYVAALHGQQCVEKHDKCRNTDRFPDVGQNMNILQESNDTDSEEVSTSRPSDCYTHAVASWCNQGHQFTRKMALIYNQYALRDIHEYSQLVRDSTRRVGCAVVKFKSLEDQVNVCVTICNYDEAAVHGVQIYKIGRSCFLSPLHKICDNGLSG